MDNSNHASSSVEPSQAKSAVTTLLINLRNGLSNCHDELLELVYSELHTMASIHLAKERHDITLQSTDLVNESYLRLFDSDSLEWKDRRYFFAAASKAMRRVLVDHARQKSAKKRIPKDAIVSLEKVNEPSELQPARLIALNHELEQLEQLDSRQAEIVELRFFGGLPETDVARMLGLSRATVSREWRAARVWLRHRMSQA